MDGHASCCWVVDEIFASSLERPHLLCNVSEFTHDQASSESSHRIGFTGLPESLDEYHVCSLIWSSFFIFALQNKLSEIAE
jgi:hypothetical protein